MIESVDKFRWLNPPGGSVLAFRFFVSFLVIVGLYWLITFFLEDEKEGYQFFFPLSIFVLAYFGSRFSSIKYNSKEIVIQNVYGLFRFSIDDLVKIKPFRSYLNFYVIVFRQNKSYSFGVASSSYFLTEYADESARSMENELRSAFEKVDKASADSSG